MMGMLHIALNVITIAMIVFVLLKLENMHRAIDRLSGVDPDAAHADAPPETPPEQ